MAKFNIVLVHPDIPGNTGSIGRTCVALNAKLILIKPLGFELDEKSVRRAGLDYWKHVDLKIYDNFDQYLKQETPQQLFFFSKTVDQNYYQATYEKDCHLIFGSETKGLPKSIMEKYQKHIYTLPMYSEHIRSLNLSNAATAVAYEALRQIEFSN
jgi:tRNA (cytidine/uridine-2'-O-)-methyltransferase